jgi:hypothetical protein
LEGKSICSGQKREFKGEIMIWRTKMQARSKAGSNLRIQFASNKSKLVLRNLDFGPYLKWAVLLNFGFQESNQLSTYITVEINYLLGHHKLASSLCICFYNILTMSSRLSINEELINHWCNVLMTLWYNDQSSQCITMLSQHQTNDCINI